MREKVSMKNKERIWNPYHKWRRVGISQGQDLHLLTWGEAWRMGTNGYNSLPWWWEAEGAHFPQWVTKQELSEWRGLGRVNRWDILEREKVNITELCIVDIIEWPEIDGEISQQFSFSWTKFNHRLLITLQVSWKQCWNIAVFNLISNNYF